MKIEEVRELSSEDLDKKIYDLKEELFNLRRKKAVGQLENLSEIKKVRKDIARVYTVKKERESGIK